MQIEFLLSAGLLLTVALIYSTICCPICAMFARRLDIVDHPGERKIHSEKIPYGGGAGIFTAFFATLLTAYLVLIFGESNMPEKLQEFIKAHNNGLFEFASIKKLLTVFAGGVLVFALGLYDDWRPLSAKVKLLLQILAATLVWCGGVQITFFFDSQIVSFFLTVSWLVLITNSFNLLDNMDGLSSGVAIIAAFFLFLINMLTAHWFVAAFLAVFIGAEFGFWRSNFLTSHKSKKIFMGDGGSLFTGFMLAVAAAAGTYYDYSGSIHAALMPVIVLGVALFDTASVIVIRAVSGKPIYVGDTNHLSHRLHRMGFSRKKSVLIIYMLGIILGLNSLLLLYVSNIGAMIVFGISLLIVALMAVLMKAKRVDKNL